MEPIHGRGFGSVRIRSVSESMTNRLLNVVLAAVLLVITGPLLLVVAVALCFESPGPVFDRYPALNREGHRFEALTFRTTEHGATRARWSRNVTPVGQFLIQTRIVALPQLINVVLGDITLIEINDYSSF
jgi:lipopolysaccharide/colanic/teichoic acid biosynthesis glycosyltransferase